MIQQPMPMMPAPAPTEFNAIKINISGATVGAPGQTCQTPAPVIVPAQPQEVMGQKINYTA